MHERPIAALVEALNALGANISYLEKEGYPPLHIQKGNIQGGTIQINIKEQRLKRIIGIGTLYKYLPLAQLPHPSFVVKKSILSKLKEPFDKKLKIASDYKQQLILRKTQLWKTFHLNQIISIMPIGGISTLDNDSIISGYKETIFFSSKTHKFLIFYILFIKIILNFYSKVKVFKFNNTIINYERFM